MGSIIHFLSLILFSFSLLSLLDIIASNRLTVWQICTILITQLTSCQNSISQPTIRHKSMVAEKQSTATFSFIAVIVKWKDVWNLRIVFFYKMNIEHLIAFDLACCLAYIGNTSNLDSNHFVHHCKLLLLPLNQSLSFYLLSKLTQLSSLILSFSFSFLLRRWLWTHSSVHKN